MYHHHHHHGDDSKDDIDRSRGPYNHCWHKCKKSEEEDLLNLISMSAGMVDEYEYEYDGNGNGNGETMMMNNTNRALPSSLSLLKDIHGLQSPASTQKHRKIIISKYVESSQIPNTQKEMCDPLMELLSPPSTSSSPTALREEQSSSSSSPPSTLSQLHLSATPTHSSCISCQSHSLSSLTNTTTPDGTPSKVAFQTIKAINKPTSDLKIPNKKKRPKHKLIKSNELDNFLFSPLMNDDKISAGVAGNMIVKPNGIFESPNKRYNLPVCHRPTEDAESDDDADDADDDDEIMHENENEGFSKFRTKADMRNSALSFNNNSDDSPLMNDDKISAGVAGNMIVKPNGIFESPNKRYNLPVCHRPTEDAESDDDADDADDDDEIMHENENEGFSKFRTKADMRNSALSFNNNSDDSPTEYDRCSSPYDFLNDSTSAMSVKTRIGVVNNEQELLLSDDNNDDNDESDLVSINSDDKNIIEGEEDKHHHQEDDFSSIIVPLLMNDNDNDGDLLEDNNDNNLMTLPDEDSMSSLEDLHYNLIQIEDASD
eukprot:TRINITY_DN1216_c0_g1_i1.p1 TRINITY_DN1216_c0_g1~~TRINITY_DN1216_c0_g1_i1.p1  ORF type:complete len:555 (-),score=227.09 TRINITY_DN1216_c0_g1_i1:260-1888(-)